MLACNSFSGSLISSTYRVLVILTVVTGAAYTRPVQDFSGVWVLDGLRSRLTVADTPQQITIQVQQDRNYLTAIEVIQAGQRTAILQSEYIVQASRRAQSTSTLDGRAADRWTLSRGGRELRIERMVSSPNGWMCEHLVFRRAQQKIVFD